MLQSKVPEVQFCSNAKAVFVIKFSKCNKSSCFIDKMLFSNDIVLVFQELFKMFLGNLVKDLGNIQKIYKKGCDYLTVLCL